MHEKVANSVPQTLECWVGLVPPLPVAVAMNTLQICLTAVGVMLFLAIAGIAWRLRSRRTEAKPAKISLEQARKRFQMRREWLEARFFTIASQSGKPRGLEWVDCEFEDDVLFARDRQSGELRAFVAVTITFRAIEGGGMENNPNVGNLRLASSVFQLEGNEWATGGRVIFNLNPAQAIEHFGQELVVVH